MLSNTIRDKLYEKDHRNAEIDLIIEGKDGKPDCYRTRIQDDSYFGTCYDTLELAESALVTDGWKLL